MKKEMDNLKKELEELKNAIRGTTSEARSNARKERVKARTKTRPAKKVRISTSGATPPALFNFGDTLQKYIGGVMDSIAIGLEEAVGVIDIDKKMKKGMKRKSRSSTVIIANEYIDHFFEKGADFMSVISDENRLKMLKYMERGGKYQKELSEEVGIKGGTFKHHMDKLVDVGFVAQEAVRGRYLITMEGREALKLAEFLYLKKYPEHSFTAQQEAQKEEKIVDEDDDDDAVTITIDEDEDYEIVEDTEKQDEPDYDMSDS